MTGWLLVLLCACSAPAAQAAGFAGEPMRALGERVMSMAVGRWANPIFGQNSQKKVRVDYLKFTYSSPDTPGGRAIRHSLSPAQQEFFRQMRLIQEVASPSEAWSHPRQVHRSRSRRQNAVGVLEVVRERQTHRASWNSGFGMSGRLVWTEQHHPGRLSRAVLERDGRNRSGRLIKISGVRVMGREDAFLVIDNGYAPQVLTLSFGGADGLLTLRNVQAGATEFQPPLIEDARLRWLPTDRHTDQWEVEDYQRNFDWVGYSRSTGGSVWPTALGSVPLEVAELASSQTATHYVSYAKPRHSRLAEPRHIIRAQPAHAALAKPERVLQAPFSGTLDRMFSDATTTGHQLPGEHEALVLLDTLRRWTH